MPWSSCLKSVSALFSNKQNSVNISEGEVHLSYILQNKNEKLSNFIILKFSICGGKSENNYKTYTTTVNTNNLVGNGIIVESYLEEYYLKTRLIFTTDFYDGKSDIVLFLLFSLFAFL